MPRTLLTFLLLASLLPACRPHEAAEASDPLDGAITRRSATRVRTQPVEQREMVRQISTTTTLESARQIDVYPRVAGVVISVQAEEGSRVEEGEVLAKLDPREAQARYEDAQVALREAQDQVARLEVAAKESKERAESAKLAYEQAKSEYERNRDAGLISALDLEKLRLTRDTNERTWSAAVLTHEGAVQDLAHQSLLIERAELTVKREALALSFTEITAPFAGVVAERRVRVGDTVTTGAAAFVLTDPEHLRCIVPRPQRELPFFQSACSEGEKVEIRIVPEAYPEREYRGTIEIVSPTIDATSGSFRLTIGVEQPRDGSPRLLPGMLARISIVTERHPDALIVPKRALRREGDRYFVYLAREGRALRVAVREGFSDDENVEILPEEAGALAAGDPVIVVGNRDLEDGEEVESEQWRSDSDPTPQGAGEEGAAEAAGEAGGSVADEGHAQASEESDGAEASDG